MRYLRLPVLLVPFLLSGCGSVLVGGSVGYDFGTLGASGVETGVGGQVEVLGFDRAGRFGLGGALELAGYASAGDGDPIAFTTLEGRWRARGIGRHGYIELGSGLGAAWSPGVHHAAVPLQAEVGLERVWGGVTGRVGVRERFIGLIGDGSPPLEAFNSLQLVLGLAIGGSRRADERALPAPAPARADSVIGRFSVEGRPVVVVVDLALLPDADPGVSRTVTGVRLIGPDGGVHYEERRDGRAAERGFGSVLEVGAAVVAYSGGELLALDRLVLPSAPLSGHSRQLFGWYGDELRPLAGPLTGYGEFPELPTTATGTARLLPGDILPFDAWAYYFGVGVELRVDPAAPPGERIRVAGGGDGPAELPITRVERQPVDGGSAAVTLYRGPVGDAGRVVRVGPDTPVELGPVYGRVLLERDPRGVLRVEPTLVRLKVRIGDAEGYVDERDFGGLGLQLAG